jgi:hypothetical protein
MSETNSWLIFGEQTRVNSRECRRAILHFAAARHSDLSGQDRARFASMLMDYCADLNLRDDILKSTPLGWACGWGQIELVRLYLSRGATVLETDAEPWASPTAWARKMNQRAIIASLEGSLDPKQWCSTDENAARGRQSGAPGGPSPPEVVRDVQVARSVSNRNGRAVCGDATGVNDTLGRCRHPAFEGYQGSIQLDRPPILAPRPQKDPLPPR